MWDTGAGGSAVVPGFVRKHVAFLYEVFLEDHTLRGELISYLRDEVSVYDDLVDSSRGPSRAIL